MKSPSTVLKIIFGATLLMLFVIFKGNIDYWISCNLALDNSFVMGFYAERIVIAQFLFVAAVLAMFYLWYLHLKTIIARKHLFLAVGVAAFYLLAYRLFPDTLEFELLSVGESGILAKIYFSDLIFLEASLFTIQGLISVVRVFSLRNRFDEWLIKLKKKFFVDDQNEVANDPQEEIPFEGFLYDEPLNFDGIDTLGYKSYATLIANRIARTPLNNKSSFAIGINGKWGIGKTSLVNQITGQLRKIDSSTIIIEFDPWTSKDSNQIIEDFFTTLKDKLSAHHSGVGSLLDEYEEKLVDANLDYISKVVGFFRSKSSVANLKEDINTAIKEIGKRLVIIIDDIDRLDKAEVVEILKLIRNNGDFANTFYIAAYDKNYLKEALKELNQHEPETFLEKIFQVEFKMPLYPESGIQKLLEANILKLLSDSDNSHSASKILDAVSMVMKPEIWEHLYLTPRDIKRLINAVATNITKVSEDVILSDFVLIELFRLKIPDLHDKLQYRTNEVLEKSASSFKYKKHDDPKSAALLRELFGNPLASFEKDSNQSISNNKSFHRYFSYGYFPTEISDAEFRETVQIQDEEELIGVISNYIREGKLDDFTRRIENLVIVSPLAHDFFRNVMKSWIRLAKILIENGESFDGSRVATLLENQLFYVNQTTSSEEEKLQLQSFIKETFQITDFSSAVVLSSLVINLSNPSVARTESSLILKSIEKGHITFLNVALEKIIEDSYCFNHYLMEIFSNVLNTRQLKSHNLIGIGHRLRIEVLIRRDLDVFIKNVIEGIFEYSLLTSLKLKRFVSLYFYSKDELIDLFPTDRSSNSLLQREFLQLVQSISGLNGAYMFSSSYDKTLLQELVLHKKSR